MRFSFENRPYLSRATDPRFLQKTPILIFILVTTLVHIVSSIDLEFSNFHIRIPLAIFSAIVAILFIYLAHFLGRKINRFRSGIVIASYFIGGAAKGWVLESGLYRFEILSSESINFRVTSGVLIVASSAAIISIVWSSVIDAWSDVSNLQKETATLKEISKNLVKDIDDKDLEQESLVFNEITRKISAIAERTSSFQYGEIEQLVNQVIRPLSRDFAPASINHQIEPINTPNISWNGLWQLLDPIKHIPTFRISTFLIALIAAAPVRQLYGWMTAIELALVVMVSLYISIFLFKPVLEKFLTRVSPPLSVIITTFGFVVFAIPPSIATTFALADTPNPQAYLVPGLITVPLFGWLLTIGNAAWEYSIEIKTELEATRDQLRWSIARINLVSWYKKGLISRLLHGPIQNSLQVALLQIRAGDDDQNSQKIVKNTIKKIEQAINESLNNGRSTKTDLMAMNEALDTWRSVANVEISMQDLSDSKLMQDTAGCAILTDIVIEACSNAIRHGACKSFKVTYDFTKSGIELHIFDDGKWNKSRSDAGLGEKLLASCTIWMDRKNDKGWNELSLELPLGASPPSFT